MSPRAEAPGLSHHFRSVMNFVERWQTQANFIPSKLRRSGRAIELGRADAAHAAVERIGNEQVPEVIHGQPTWPIQ